MAYVDTLTHQPINPRHFEILVEAMAEVKAISDGLSQQSLASVVQGCIDEINALQDGIGVINHGIR